MADVTYYPEVFEAGDEAAARDIILTPQGGQSPEERWRRETPYLARLLADRLGLETRALVIDYGCGLGRMSRALIELCGVRVIGVDDSARMRAMAPRYVRSPLFQVASRKRFRSLVAGGLRADAAIAVWVLQHCLDPQEDIDLIQSALAPGASLCVVNNLHRAVPVQTAVSRTVQWASDGVDVRQLLADRFPELASGVLDPEVVGREISEITFWATYRAGPDAAG
jgi:SAM-dependent methyltransferase